METMLRLLLYIAHYVCALTKEVHRVVFLEEDLLLC